MHVNNGYQRYLSSYHHQPSASNVDDAVPREGLHSKRDPRRESLREDSATVISALTDQDVNSPPDTSNRMMKRTISSTRQSLSSFNNKEVHEMTDVKEGNQPSSSLQPNNKTSNSLQQFISIDNVNLDDPNDMRSFLMKPCPKGDGVLQCCIRRNKGIKNALFPEYRIYLKSNNNSNKTETFLMTSKKRAGSKTSNYLISMNRCDHDKTSDGILGKLRSNFLGTEYMIYDHGNNPAFDDSYYDEKNDGDIRCELGAILYAANTSLGSGSKGPRKMKACISKVDAVDGNPDKVWQPTTKSDGMVACFKDEESSDFDKLECFENKAPEWNDEVGAYV